MNYYEQSFLRIYENFVFSLKIYPNKHHQEVLCHQVLERIDNLFQYYQKLELPTYQLVQWKNHYKFKIQQYYIMNGGTK
jgi:hypothetical protein